jgi:soluble lytic murein transglycosylase-like protein
MEKLSSTLAIAVGASLLFTTSALPFCFEQAGAEYGVAPEILWALSTKESGGNPTAYNQNSNGSYDYCHMQINSGWYRVLGKERWDALSDPCQCTRTGAWILSNCMRKYGYSWKAIGCYHSQTPDKRDQYAKSIAKILSSAKKAYRVEAQQQKTESTNAEDLSSLVWGETNVTVTR